MKTCRAPRGARELKLTEVLKTLEYVRVVLREGHVN